jgi:hypothetical protein
MDTLLTESMISSFSSSGLRFLGFYREASSGSFLLETAGNFRQNGTQLELIEYHAGRVRRGDQELAVQGSMSGAEMSSKSRMLRVASVAWRDENDSGDHRVAHLREADLGVFGRPLKQPACCAASVIKRGECGDLIPSSRFSKPSV